MGIIKLVVWFILFLGCGLNNPFSPKKIPEVNPPKLEKPLNGSKIDKGMVHFIWEFNLKREEYRFQLSKDINFSSLIKDTLLKSSTYKCVLVDTLATYYWRVKIKTKPYRKWSNWSEVWQFRIRDLLPNTPYNPSPPDGAIDVTVKPTLRWECVNPDLDTLIFTVYLSKTTPPTKIDSIISYSKEETTTIYYKLKDSLEYFSKYFWKIEARDLQGNKTLSDIWEFQTIGRPTNPPNKPERPTSAGIQYVDLSYTFSTKANDPDGDDIYYVFDFGDGTYVETHFMPNNTTVSVQHTYKRLGNFYVKVKACDVNYNESEWSDPIQIEVKTGPGACWVALHKDENKIVKLGVGGSILFEVIHSDLDPLTMAIDQRPSPDGGFCWVASTYNQRVFKFSPSGKKIWMQIFYPGANVNPDKARNPSTPHIDRHGNCWILFSWTGDVAKLNPLGDTIKTFHVDVTHQNVRHPSAIAFDEVRGHIWVAVAALSPPGYIILYDTLGNMKWYSLDKFNPPYLEVNPINGDCWVANRGYNEIVRITTAGHIERFGEFYNPTSLSVDYYRNCVWIADTDNNRVVRLSFSGDKKIIDGFAQPVGIEVDLQDGSCWVSDTYNDRVVKLDAAGNVLFVVENLIRPVGLVVDNYAR